MRAHLEGCGFPYLCTDSVDEAIAWLKHHGILTSKVSRALTRDVGGSRRGQHRRTSSGRMRTSKRIGSSAVKVSSSLAAETG
jgi:hypothetical protein